MCKSTGTRYAEQILQELIALAREHLRDEGIVEREDLSHGRGYAAPRVAARVLEYGEN